MNLKEMVSDNKKVRFVYYKLNQLWYETECGFRFPVSINDTGDGVFKAEDKALYYMRYIRIHIKYLKDAEAVQIGVNNEYKSDQVK